MKAIVIPATAAVVIAQLALSSAARAAVDFNRDIRPILSDNCVRCHGPDAPARKAGLRLDTREGLLLPRPDSDRVVVAGKSAESPLYQRLVTTDDDDRMPPVKSGKTLSVAQIAAVREWIDSGAAWQQHWAFVPPVRSPIPVVSDRRWVRNPIDNFVRARLDKDGLAASPEASRQALLRRVTLDLTGLPPTLHELDKFVKDRSPRAYEKVVDRLLASPRYGERMVLEWLQAARYADTNGFQSDGERAMWPWRDWAVRAFNSNMPFDRFTVEQLAGDLLPHPTIDQKIATGFNRNHSLNGEGGAIAEESRVAYVMDRAETTATVWLGLTAGCARCHDHKYDPLKQAEYYRLYGFFNQVAETGNVDQRDHTAAPVYEFADTRTLGARDAQNATLQKLKKEQEGYDTEVRKGQDAWEKAADPSTLSKEVAAALARPAANRSVDERKRLTEQFLAQFPEHKARQKAVDEARQQLDAMNAKIRITMVMADAATPRETFVLSRGEYDKPREKVTADVPSWLPPLPPQATHNRLALARWLVDPQNPLPARVAVNRAWQMFFGTGIVKTSEDFGTQGDPPSHPELLDWLATEFVGSGWNVKALHRRILTSATYRQASRTTPETLENDPENRLLARGPRFRLSAYAIRDQALALSGLLVDKLGGPPVRPYQPDNVWEDFSYGQIRYRRDTGSALYRRSLYVFWRRSVGPTTLFDTPARQVCTVRQFRTNSPLHALTTMNDPTFVEAARVWAERLLRDGQLTQDERLALAFRMATARNPTPEEGAVLTHALEGFLQRFRRDPAAAEQLLAVGDFRSNSAIDAPSHAAYTAVASLILNLDETLTKE